MSCRSNAGNSAMTSYARASSGLGDVQTLHLFHRLTAEGRAGAVPPPSGQALTEWIRNVTPQIENDQNINDGQRQRILNRLNNLGEYTPDGPTFYAWQNIGQRARDGQGALNQTYGLLCMAAGLTPEQGAARVRELESQFDQGEVARNWQPPAELLERVGEWQGYQMGNRPFYGTGSLPHDRRTLYVLATLATEARVLAEQRPTTAPAQSDVQPANCPNCGQFLGEGNHDCLASTMVERRVNRRWVRESLGQMWETPRGRRAIREIATYPPSEQLIINNVNISERASLFLAGMTALEAEQPVQPSVPAQPVDTPPIPALQTRCPNCGQFTGTGDHACPAQVTVPSGPWQGQPLGVLLAVPGGNDTLQILANSNLYRNGSDVISNQGQPNEVNVSEQARQLLAGRAALAAEQAAVSPVAVVQPIVMPTISTSTTRWDELYIELPEDAPDDLNAPDSNYDFSSPSTPLSTREGEVASFNTLNEKWRTGGFQALEPGEPDRLYDYLRRRVGYQAMRLNDLQNYALVMRTNATPQVTYAHQQLAEGLREYQKRRAQFNQMHLQRQAVGYPVGADPDGNGAGISADAALSTWLASRTDIPQATGQGLVWDRPEPEPQFALPNYPAPSPTEAEPLYFRVRDGQGERLRRSIGQSGLPIVIAEATTPIPPGAVVLNWGDYDWAETNQFAVINSPEAIAVARDKLLSLERLGELAPASTTRPAEAVARFGSVFAGKGRAGQSGSGKALIQNPTGGPTNRPLGNLSATAVTGYDYYQEYLPERTEYRALVLGGEVIALYKRVPQGVEPGQLRPDSFEYQPLPTIGQRQLEASQTAMDRVGLDFGGVDLVEDTATGRLLVLEVNSAPGLGQESLVRLYNAAHAQLHSPEEE